MVPFASNPRESSHGTHPQIPTPPPLIPINDIVVEADEHEGNPSVAKDEAKSQKLSAVGPRSRSDMDRTIDEMKPRAAGETR